MLGLNAEHPLACSVPWPATVRWRGSACTPYSRILWPWLIAPRIAPVEEPLVCEIELWHLILFRLFANSVLAHVAVLHESPFGMRQFFPPVVCQLTGTPILHDVCHRTQVSYVTSPKDVCHK